MNELNAESKKIQKVIASMTTANHITVSRNMINNFSYKYRDGEHHHESHSRMMYLFGFLAGVIESKFDS